MYRLKESNPTVLNQGDFVLIFKCETCSKMCLVFQSDLTKLTLNGVRNPKHVPILWGHSRFG